MKVRINTLEGKFYPEVKRAFRSWKVVRLTSSRYSSEDGKWTFESFPKAVSNDHGTNNLSIALDLLESYVGAGVRTIEQTANDEWWAGYLDKEDQNGIRTHSIIECEIIK